ncbi:uncharacterized protein B0I36DRAFT_128630 [Microdochium trichocladiopsis]|uniref:Uncharacterized protein n=1 Tax=Microdochium trichocladiopsis TaxID=1682393 RepID=A0A9P9BSS5_9PEZI|nr:uncharacterized protein B0I36DRAFT_128630 [Microdochium trichocladiopsis]KAH7029126.1 hypothetical protein B0I36DRAFT_128630 [Microdochium trichocladiopsis]
MTARQAVSILKKSASTLPAKCTLVLHCLVKPGASKIREGISAITDEAVEMNVAAPAQDGKANKAVLQILARALLVSKSDLQIVQGMKAREKTIMLPGSALCLDATRVVAGDEEARLVEVVRNRLQSYRAD